MIKSEQITKEQANIIRSQIDQSLLSSTNLDDYNLSVNSIINNVLDKKEQTVYSNTVEKTNQNIESEVLQNITEQTIQNIEQETNKQQQQLAQVQVNQSINNVLSQNILRDNLQQMQNQIMNNINRLNTINTEDYVPAETEHRQIIEDGGLGLFGLPFGFPGIRSGGGGGGGRIGNYNSFLLSKFTIPEMYVALPSASLKKGKGIVTIPNSLSVSFPKRKKTIEEEQEIFGDDFEQTPFGKRTIVKITSKSQLKSGAKIPDLTRPSIKRKTANDSDINLPSFMGNLGM
jgi:hypothetical protein